MPPHPTARRAVSLVLAIVAVSAGGIALLAGLARGFAGTSEEARALRDTVASLEERSTGLTKEHKLLEEERRRLENDQERLAKANAEVQEAYTRACAEIEDLKNTHRAELAPIEDETAAIIAQARLEQTTLRDLAQQEQRKQNLSQWLHANQRYLMTLFLPDNRLRSATLFVRGNQILMLTDAEGIPGTGVIFTGTICLGPRAQPTRVELTTVRVDATGTLASLATVGNGFETNGLRLPPAPNLRVGDPIYVVGTVQMGEFAVEHNVFDGTIAAERRQIGGVDLIQVALPANQGSEGALVLDGQGQVLGILAIRRRNGAAQAYLIPSDVIAAALPSL